MTSGIRRPTVSISRLAVVPILSLMAVTQETKLIRYVAGPKPLISITNDYGTVTVRPSGGNQILFRTSIRVNTRQFTLQV